MNVVAEVIKDLCSDIIIGRDVLGEHSKVVLNFNGPREELVIGAVPDPTSSKPSASLTSLPAFFSLNCNSFNTPMFSNFSRVKIFHSI